MKIPVSLEAYCDAASLLWIGVLVRLTPSNPDVETLVRRIDAGDIDLQPDFQRGEVWSHARKQRLIDSILRNWHVPPIHVILPAGGARQEVLDGQQRLMAIRDFVHGLIAVDGAIPPISDEIESLDGLIYSQLPADWRRRFDRFAISVIQIDNYLPEEPAELFFRLNQYVRLTAAEQRNAFYGPAREQVREVSEHLEHGGVPALVSFSNARMGYDDVLARTMLLLERGTIAEKVTASHLADRYRARSPFPPGTVDIVKRGIDILSRASGHSLKQSRLNKAAFFSWLWFAIDAFAQSYPPGVHFETFFDAFNDAREGLKTTSWTHDLRIGAGYRVEGSYGAALIHIFNDRSTARVSDVSSIVARDVVLWIFFADHVSRHGGSLWFHRKLLLVEDAFRRANLPSDPNVLLESLADAEWGRIDAK